MCSHAPASGQDPAGSARAPARRRVSRDAEPDAALAAALRRLREERRVSREALALRAGLATGTLARIELARAAPGWDTVRRLAGALGVSLVDVALAVEDGAGGRPAGEPAGASRRRRPGTAAQP
jgi:ribosome-binding protein aMBF1 (putative translation factor)